MGVRSQPRKKKTLEKKKTPRQHPLFPIEGGDGPGSNLRASLRGSDIPKQPAYPFAHPVGLQRVFTPASVMPHKHKRKRGEDPDHDLPPSQRARPLPVGKKTKTQGPNPASEPKNRSKKHRKEQNDAPRGFRRVMAAASGKKFRSGLDDGTTTSKKAKGKQIEEKEPSETPKIRPGEDLRSFSQRVDASLPISGLKHRTIVKDGKDEHGVKVWRTRKELKMHKLFEQWRAEERKAKEKREEELEEEAEKAMENDGEGVTSSSYMAALDEGEEKVKGRGKKKRGKQDDDDPWAALKKKRAEAKIGLHDVAMAPPELHKKKSRQLQVSEGAGVDVGSIPKKAGSLKRREELQAERDQVLEAYRKIREHEQAKLNAAAQ